jgi:hypothetical protein
MQVGVVNTAQVQVEIVLTRVAGGETLGTTATPLTTVELLVGDVSTSQVNIGSKL